VRKSGLWQRDIDPWHDAAAAGLIADPTIRPRHTSRAAADQGFQSLLARLSLRAAAHLLAKSCGRGYSESVHR
jgi:hypothetical protein